MPRRPLRRLVPREHALCPRIYALRLAVAGERDRAFQIDDTMFGEGTEMRASVATMADLVRHGMLDEIGQRLLDNDIYRHAAYPGNPFDGADGAGPLLCRIHRAREVHVSILDTH